jgi:hypothetical protein
MATFANNRELSIVIGRTVTEAQSGGFCSNSRATQSAIDGAFQPFFFGAETQGQPAAEGMVVSWVTWGYCVLAAQIDPKS